MRSIRCRSTVVGARLSAYVPLTVTLLVCTLVAIPDATAAPPNRWTLTGSLVFARHDHTATLLSDGSVLVAGSILAAAERFDPATGGWAETELAQDDLLGQSATLLTNGTVLVAGGGESVRKAAWLYDPAADHWIATGPLSKGRDGHTATMLTDGRVLVAGGYVTKRGHSRATAAAEIYDPATGRWRRTGALSTARILHTAALLADGRVLVVGGASRNHAPLATAEIFDPETGRWTEVAPMSEARIQHTLTVLADGRALVVGGSPHPLISSGAEIFNPSTGEWTQAAPLPEARKAHTATRLQDGRVLVAGGIGSGDPPGTGEFLSSAIIYDPATDAWIETAPMSVPRVGHTATLLDDGRVLVAGGLGPDAAATAEIYDPSF